MFALSVPLGYRRSQRVSRPKLDALTGIIDHSRYLLRLTERELIDRERRTTPRAIIGLMANARQPQTLQINWNRALWAQA